MIPFTNEAWERMQHELHTIETTAENNLQRAERSYLAVQNTLQDIKAFIVQYVFKDRPEEILFFREVKPKFLKELIYFQELFYIEANLPLADKETVMAYYRQVQERIRTFIERNHMLYTYYRTGKHDLDELYFIRDTNGQPYLPEYILDMDPMFSTVNSFKLGTILAYERLNTYLSESIYHLQHETAKPASSGISEVALPWTDKKAGLIEILYGIQSMGSLNNAHAELRQIANLLEAAFNVDLGNYSRTFQEIRIRKKSRTPFLDRMKEMLIKRMDEADEYFS